MNILGIQWGDNATVCVLKNDFILTAVAEERFTRIKNDMSFPLKSINFCKDIAKNKIDHIVIASTQHNYISQLTKFYSIPIKKMTDLQYEYYYKLFYEKKDIGLLNYLKKFWVKNQYPKNYWSKVSVLKEKTFSNDIIDIVSKATKVKKKFISKIEHHKCHANYAYYTSNFFKKKCLVFTLDGSGDYGINATISVGENGKLRRVYSTRNAIIGRVYSHITLMLGMRRLEHEYKIMGLAPYSQKKIDEKVYSVFS